MTITYEYGSALYINLTNRCPCDCVFCLRLEGEGVNANQSLWLEHEPSLDEIETAIHSADVGRYNEIVFCGYGEPTERLDVLLNTAQLIKSKTNVPIRLNTNGLSDLINGKETAPLLAECIDRISISLNAPDAESYYELCKPTFGIISFDAMLRFALACKGRLADITLSVVGRALDEKQVNQCRELCEELGITLRVR